MTAPCAAGSPHAVGLAILTFVTVFPLYTIIITSLKPLADVRSEFHWIPSNLTFQPYIDIWSTVPLAHYFVNSLIVAVSATVISVDGGDLRRLRDLALPLPRARRCST